MTRLEHFAACTFIAAAATLAGCSARPAPAAASATEAPSGRTGATVTDSASIARLERQARALAKTSGCASSAQCASAPVGSKACGGPRYYIPYCRATTDSAALFAKLDELERAEAALNQTQGVVSDCMLREPPKLVLAGQRCGVR